MEFNDILKGINIVDKLINLTKSNKLMWKSNTSNNKEQFISEYIINDDKKIIFDVTKQLLPLNTNFYLYIYYDKNKLSKKIYSYYYKNVHEIFDLFVYVKYYICLNDVKYKNDFIDELLFMLDNLDWYKKDNSYHTNLEIDNIRQYKAELIVNRNTINVYLVSKSVKILINSIENNKLYNILRF